MASDLLSIGASGARAARAALDVTAQNIANASSDGYVRRSVRLEDGELKISAGMHAHRVAIGAIDLAGARIVDLAEHKALRPIFKSFGTSLPGYYAGHFRLRDRSKAFVLVTDRTRVLVLPERSGRKLLLSLRHPQALLDALSAQAGSAPR